MMTRLNEQAILSFTPKSGERIVVVGGCGGIGRAVVSGLLSVGAIPIVFDLPVSIKAHEPEHGVDHFDIDVRQASSVETAFSSLKDKIDGCVILPGHTGDLVPGRDLSIDEYDLGMQLNARGTFLCAKAAAQIIRQDKSKTSSIVLMSSGLATAGRPGYLTYASAKAAINSMTRTFATELAPHVRVNAVAPGGVDTAFLRGGTGLSDEKQEMRISVEDYAALVPLRRMARAEEIAAPILFLLSEGAEHISGQTIHINGGALMRD